MNKERYRRKWEIERGGEEKRDIERDIEREILGERKKWERERVKDR